MIAVSHDRYFIDRLFDELLALGLNREGRRCIGTNEWINKTDAEKGVYSLWNEMVNTYLEETKNVRCSNQLACGSREGTFRKDSA